MSDFGDFDPEDAWDDGDHPLIRLAILLRIFQTLDDDPARREARRADGVRLADKLIDELDDTIGQTVQVRNDLENA